MIAFDTNALVRMLIEDDPDQVQIIREMVLYTEKHSGRIIILTEVLIKTVWVLESAYQCTRQEIFTFLETLLKTHTFVTSDPAAVRAAVAQYKKGGDFADLVIVNRARQLHVEKLISFDRKFQKKFPGYVVESLEAI